MNVERFTGAMAAGVPERTREVLVAEFDAFTEALRQEVAGARDPSPIATSTLRSRCRAGEPKVTRWPGRRGAQLLEDG
ncbi:hypothetical protein Lesp01_57250 [Lentzea sp. NBRC 102530]|nr:hypothetical protein Lesp01_57250 [Lentzea sp. NBRC 102530]